MTSDVSSARIAARLDPGPSWSVTAAAAGSNLRPEAVRQPARSQKANEQVGNTEAARNLGEAAQQVAERLYPSHDVQVSSFFDEASNRQVFRVAERRSGEILSQFPAEELLHLYAANRADSDGPLLRVRV